jgi:prophage regulatory protein
MRERESVKGLGTQKRTPNLVPYRELGPKKDIPYSREHIRRLVKDGRFPKPLKIGYGIAWLEDELDRWLAEREAA